MQLWQHRYWSLYYIVQSILVFVFGALVYRQSAANEKFYTKAVSQSELSSQLWGLGNWGFVHH